MNRASIVSELAKVLQVNETEAERILKAFAQVLGPIAAEVPPYFERYFETQIQLVLQRIEDLERSTQQQIADLRQSTQQQIAELRQSTRQQIAELKQSTQQQIAELKQSTQQQIADLRQSTQQQIAELKQSMQQQIDDLRQQFAEFRQYVERRIDRLEKWLLSVLVMILSGVLAIIFRIYFSG